MGSLRQNSLMIPQDGAIVMSEANPGYPLKGDFERMARKRFQRGQLFERGTNRKVWVGRWREDLIVDGKISRRQVKEIIGTRNDYPTRRLALRALEQRLSTINDPSYRARPTALFCEFAEKWQRIVLTQHKPSTQAAMRSQIRCHLMPVFGNVQLKDMNGMLIQRFVSSCDVSPKTVRNLIATLRTTWASAKTWEFVAHDPFAGLVLPKWDREEQACFTAEEMQRIIAAAPAPYDTVFWLVATTGIRRGEVCGLNVGHVDLKNRLITVRKSRWNSHVTDNKSRRPRLFSISPRLAERLASFVDGREADAPLFLTSSGCRLHPENLSKRVLKPILDALGIKGGMHAFRHGNATALDTLNAPMKLRQQRLGHMDPNTTMDYTHLVSEDDRKIAEQLDGLLYPLSANESGAVQ